MRRRRQTSEGQHFGAWLVALGATATAYHASEGRLRVALRKLDYWQACPACPGLSPLAEDLMLRRAGKGTSRFLSTDVRSCR